MPDTDFQPLRHGFHFVNDFTNHIGPVTTRGLCGGMAYAALDYYCAHMPVPVTELPAEGSRLRDYIFRRQVDSLVSQGPGFLSRIGSIWNSDRDRFMWGVRDEDEFGRLCRTIDAGNPLPLGMISVRPDLLAHHQSVAIGYDRGARVEDIRIRIYDPNWPNVVVTLVPDPTQNRFRAVLADGTECPEAWRTYFVDEGYGAAAPPAFERAGARQDNWRWCNRCQALAYAGSGAGPCVAGGVHDHAGSGNYVLVADASAYIGQDQWRWCNRCQALAYGAGAPGRCAADGAHDHRGSGNYVVADEGSGERGQDGWRWCNRCQGMAYGAGDPGPCPAGGGHDHTGSGRYRISHL